MEDARSFDFYRTQSPMTHPGRYQALIEVLPDDLSALARIIQGQQVYDVVAADFYGFAVPADRLVEIHIRPIEQRLERLIELDDRPLNIPRPVEKRAVASGPTSIRRDMRTTGSANTGIMLSDAGFWQIRNSTTYGASDSTSTM